MKTALIIIQIILSILLAFLIFMQAPGDAEQNSNLLSQNQFQKRGWEKMTYNFTLLILALFIISSIIQTLI